MQKAVLSLEIKGLTRPNLGVPRAPIAFAYSIPLFLDNVAQIFIFVAYIAEVYINEIE